MTGAAAFRAGVAQLQAAGIADPARDVRLLLAHAMGISADKVMLALHDPLPDAVAAALEACLSARANRQPVSQITGQRQFWGRDFIVTPDVLDPRPETETLIAAALDQPFTRLLDLGTGSGAILLTLLAERPAATGLGADLSPDALVVAAANAEALGLAHRAQVIQSDWWAAITGRFDLIVSNPPYIALDEMAGLAPDVRDHEPHMALTDGADGLSAYRAIAAGALAHLAPGGRLMVEIGPIQGAAVASFFVAAGFCDVVVLPDFDGRDRVVSARAPV
ncbi:peptide chain release factor N(5)-glutamine methyltransferase [Gemmobacter sp. JM10B15]|uniref:Release factor glutamine methyltransferase n=1 Tax=Gemmobacter denitrificans TaxID=3123040 RepID=A0ABU8BQN0_9RHOB